MPPGQSGEAGSNQLLPTRRPDLRAATSYQWLLESAAARYGLSLLSVGVALGLAQAFVYFDFPLPFAAFGLCAIAITFWYGGKGPGILAAVLTASVRTFVFEPELGLSSRLVYDLVFLIFAVLMTQATRARDELEVRVAERTAAARRANDELRLEIAGHMRAEEKLRQSEAYLAEAQKLTHIGSWAGDFSMRELLHSSEEHSRLYGFDPGRREPSFEETHQRVHPEDRARLIEAFQTASRAGTDVAVDYRIVLPDGTIRYVQAVGHPVVKPSGERGGFAGFLMDVTERRQADEERERLRQVQADLVHISRVSTMGELTASLAHEVNQPIAATVTDAKTCLRWLERETPDVDEARQAAERAVKDATRAAEIVSRIRLLFKKGTPQHEPFHVNDVVREMITILSSEAARHGISVQTDLSGDVPQVLGDRVQVQQVMMNLIMNSIDAMKDVHGPRDLVITSRATIDGVMLTVTDTGTGLPAQHADRIFNAFFTTKSHGTGMGLSISRSIVESHGGQLWAAQNSPHGARFHVTFPTTVEANESAAGRAHGLHHR